MEFQEVARRRRMCRAYTGDDVPEEQVDAIVRTASRSPSAGNTQPQEFIVVRDRSVKRQLGRAALGQMFLAEAPVVIAVVSDTDRSKPRYGRRGVEFYSVVDGAFASMLVLLAAVFDDQAVSEVLGLPPNVRPIGLIAIGHCAEPPEHLRRRHPHELVHRDRYGTRG